MFGVTTYYRREDDGSLSIKMEGRLEGTALFEQVAVLREVDLHSKWAPFCSSSLTVAHLNKLDTIGWFVVGLPHFGLMRDACFRAMGCDNIFEDGSIMLVGQGLMDKPKDGVSSNALEQHMESSNEDKGFEYLTEDPVLKTLDIPEVPKGIGRGRMTIRTFQAIIHIESPTEATTRIVANVDPNLPLIPQSLIDFLMKKLCGVLLNKLQSAAKKVSKDPIYNNHAQLMRLQEPFYKGWLMTKFQQICEIRNWTMPPVTCFELTEEQLERAEESFRKKTKKDNRRTVKLYQTVDDEKLDKFLQSRQAGETGDLPTPRLRTHSVDSDSISEISHLSGSTQTSKWKRNPINRYLKELELKTEKIKQREIEKSRERAANRLKPKELDESSRSRLEELRTARQIRLGRNISVPIPANGEEAMKMLKEANAKVKNDWVTLWANRSAITRIFLMKILVIGLFGLMHGSSFVERKVAERITISFLSEAQRQDIAAMIYLLLATVIHFFLCYVAMIYAFSSLQLGRIAGRQAKRFYTQNVHLIVLGTSTGMLVFSLALAFWRTSSQWAFWKTFCSSNFFMESEAIASALDKHVFPLDQVEEECKEFVIDAWRYDAYATLRLLLTYSATFLLSVLFLFSSTAKNAARSSSSSNMSDAFPSDRSADVTAPSSTKSLPSIRIDHDGPHGDPESDQNTPQSSILRKGAKTPVLETPKEKSRDVSLKKPVGFGKSVVKKARQGGSRNGLTGVSTRNGRVQRTLQSWAIRHKSKPKNRVEKCGENVRGSGSMLTFLQPTSERVAAWFGPQSSQDELLQCVQPKEFNHEYVGMTNPFIHLTDQSEEQLLLAAEIDNMKLTIPASIKEKEFEKEASHAWWPSNSFLPSRQKEWRILTYRQRVGKGRKCYERVRDAALDWEFQTNDGGMGMLEIPSSSSLQMMNSKVNGQNILQRGSYSMRRDPTSGVEKPMTFHRGIGSFRRMVTFSTSKFPLRKRLYAVNPVMVIYDLVDQR
ncbi:MAG: hypothetical protein SGBAC_005526 [Bacillariaceae sp.]